MDESNENGVGMAAPSPRGRPFEKGNPGRPPGSRNKTTRALEALLDGQAEAITSKIVELALAGDRVAMRLCFDRILAARSDRSVSFEIPELRSTSDAASALAAVVADVASGAVSLNEGVAMSQLIQATARAFADQDFEKRIDALEKAEARRK